MYGLLAEITTPEALVEAVRAARRNGYVRVEAYSPFPIEELTAALGGGTRRVSLVALLGGVLGGTGGYLLQWYAATISYPLNIGGRPLHSWPSFIPVTFELAVLGAALATVVGMLAMNGLPRLHHPLFDVHEFELASRNRFFLCLRSKQPNFDPQRAREWLESLQPRGIWEVPE